MNTKKIHTQFSKTTCRKISEYTRKVTESVFNGSDLGKQYSAKSILERCHKEGREAPQQKQEFVRQSVSKTGSPKSNL